jgi:hypothetical protein
LQDEWDRDGYWEDRKGKRHEGRESWRYVTGASPALLQLPLPLLLLLLLLTHREPSHAAR